METLFIYANEIKRVIALQISTVGGYGKEAGFWLTEKNQILLGADRYKEWQALYGNVVKQKAFLAKLDKVEQLNID